MILEMYCGDEYFDEYPTHAEIEFTPELTERILELHQALVNVKADAISEYFDTTAEYLDKDGTEWDGRTESPSLRVYANTIRWEANIKNTNILIYTDEIPINEIEEIHKVLKTPDNNLPLLIADLKSEQAKNILQERLRK